MLYTVYSLRNKKTKVVFGKTWTSIGNLKLHLSRFLDKDGCKLPNYPYDDYEVIEFVIDESKCFDVNIMADDIHKKRIKSQIKNEICKNNKIEKAERELLQQLKNKYER